MSWGNSWQKSNRDSKKNKASAYHNDKKFGGKGGRNYGEDSEVRAKKALGQHFLVDLSVADRIADIFPNDLDAVLEIGPGMGVLTKRLMPTFGLRLGCAEIDKESVKYLAEQEWAKGLYVVEGDFLVMDEALWVSPENKEKWEAGGKELASMKVGVIGNFPYNISTQIVFKVIETDLQVEMFGGMFQKEVAVRLCAGHGNKDYGITSVLLQAYYDCSYLFDVGPECFNPPPNVVSGVMVAKRKGGELGVSYAQLKKVVKMAFGQRRKTMLNALRPLAGEKVGFVVPEKWAGKRAEQLSVDEFVELAKIWDAWGK